VNVVISMLREQARKQGVELQSNLSQLPDIPLDKSRLVEAIFNIAQNAIQALGDSGTVHFNSSAQSDHVLLQIIDDGPGIPEEIQEKIFDLYFSTKDEDGTGLGLPYAERIVKDHNGTLTVKSSLGKGTAFLITLPLGFMTGSKA
jgi:signal transduction histidine kinase